MIAPLQSQAGEILSLLRSQPYLQERILIRDGDPGTEELIINSNILNLKSRTLGRLTRSNTKLKSAVAALNALSGGHVSLPADLARDHHDWKLFLSGNRIHPGDPRYEKAFDLILKEINDPKWSLKEGVQIKTDFPELIVERETWEKDGGLISKKKKSTQRLSIFKACQVSSSGKSGCRIPDFGVWFHEP